MSVNTVAVATQTDPIMGSENINSLSDAPPWFEKRMNELDSKVYDLCNILLSLSKENKKQSKKIKKLTSMVGQLAEVQYQLGKQNAAPMWGTKTNCLRNITVITREIQEKAKNK